MILATWSDKGGVGKSTLATLLAHSFGAPLVDLDPQGDATRWAKKADHPHETPGEDARQLLEKKANSKDLIVVDCPPGHDPRALMGAAFARLTIIPTRSGDSDLVALGRSLKILRDLKGRGNRGLTIGVVLNGYRHTGRAEVTEKALRNQAKAEGYVFLGTLGHRAAVEAAYADGRDLVAMGGATAEEAGALIAAVKKLRIF